MAMTTPAELWSDALQKMCGRVAHALKGSLNGVSVNLEVVRSRSENPNAPASAVSSFAAAAATQLEDVIALSEAMLFLTRAPRDPVDLALVVRHIGNILAAPARSEGHRLSVASGFDALGRTRADAATVRLTVAVVLLAAIDASSDVRCLPVTAQAAPAIRIEGAGAAVEVPREVAELAADAGIDITSQPNAISIVFPS